MVYIFCNKDFCFPSKSSVRQRTLFVDVEHCWIYTKVNKKCWIKIYIPEENSNSFFYADAFAKVCVLLCDIMVVSDPVDELKIFIQRYMEVPKEPVRVCLKLLNLSMKLSFPRQTSNTVHGMNPPQMLGNSKIFHNSSKKTLIQNTEKKQLFPSLILPPHIPQLSSGNHFSSNWQYFDRLLFAASDAQKWSMSQLCAWRWVVCHLVVCSVHSTVVTASSLRRVLLRVLRRVQCA